MPKNSLEITSTAIDVKSADGTPRSGWVEFSDGKCYHWSRDVDGNLGLSTRSRAYEGAPWKHRFFKSPVRLALLVLELG